MTNQFPSTDLVTVEDVQHLIATVPGVQILDVRTGGEFETSHIPGSYNVPLDTLSEHASELANVDHPVVLVCQSGGRASQAHGTLTGQGKDRLHILDGGMTAWVAAGGEITHGDTQRWAMDRQVRLVAGGLALTGVLVSIAVPQAKWLAGAIGGGLFYSAVSDTCAMAALLAKLPYNRTDRCDVAGVIDAMSADVAQAGNSGRAA